MAGRGLKIGGIAVAAAGAFYLYQAGGSPKVAEKQLEYDASKLKSKVQSGLHGTGKEAENGIKLSAEKAGQQFDSALSQAKTQANKVDAKLEEYRKEAGAKFDQYKNEAGKDMKNAVDTFDRKVEEGAAKAKSGISSWFGGK